MNNYRYILEKGSKKFPCPGCGKKTFVRYIDTETGEYLPDQYGRCDREINCAYHAGPKAYLQNENFLKPDFIPARKSLAATHHVSNEKFSCIPEKVFQRSLAAYERNNFVQYLVTLFDSEIAACLSAKYHIGTSRHFPDATVFWQIDQQDKVRTGKIMQYSAVTGKRVKEPFNRIAWAHKALKTSDFALRQCLFGSHLLKSSSKPVAIVESEKTAIIASAYLPEFIWLATGGLSSLNANLLKEVGDRKITLFPDLGAFERWAAKVQGIQNVTISDLLERNASAAERDKGLDIADYLVKYPLSEFLESTTTQAGNKIVEPWMPAGWYYELWTRQDGVEVKTLVNGIAGYPASWDQQKGVKEAPVLLNDKIRVGPGSNTLK